MLKIMRIYLLLIFITQFVPLNISYAEEQPQELQVIDPYLEMHTGAANSFPIFFVVKRTHWIQIIKRHTDWYKITTLKKSGNNVVGWVHRSQMAETLTPTGEKMQIKDINHDNYLEHKWETGLIGGDFKGSTMMSIYSDYQFTENFATEISLSQIIGNFSSRILVSANLILQPFPEWRVSPFFRIGAGAIKTSVNSTLAQLNDTTDNLAQMGFGVKMYLTRRFVLRVDYQNHIIFQSRDDNEEIPSWQAGFAFFF